MDYGEKFAPGGVFGIDNDGFANPIYLGPGTITTTVFGYLAGTTSNIQAQINAVASGRSFRGGYDASSNLFPSTGGSGGGGAINAGDQWIITVQGVLGGITAVIGTTITALVNVPGQTAGNWNVPQNQVTSVFGRMGAIIAQTGDYTVSQVTGAAPIASPTFTGTVTSPVLNLTNNTNQLVLGTTNTMTFTMASLTGSHIFTLPNADSNSIIPSSAPSNQFATGISSGGVVSYAQPAFSNISGIAGISQGGTGQSTANTAFNALAPSQTGNINYFLQTDGSNTSWQPLGSFGVTSFNTRVGDVVPLTDDYTVSQVTGAAPLASPAFTGTPTAPTQTQGDGSTKLATTNYVDIGLATKQPTITVLPIANGGTGQSTANNALNALLPSQTGNANKVFTTNGTNSSWTNLSTLGVSSFNTRTGAVTSQTGDYSFSQISGTASVTQGGTGITSYNTGDLIYASANTVLSTIAASAAGQVFVSNGLGIVPGFTPNPSVGQITLYNNTSQLILGTTNTTTFTMASLTGSRIVTLPDANSNTVVPSSGTANQFAKGISAAGVITYAQPAFSNLTGFASVAQGGTGITSYSTGDLLTASNSSTLIAISSTASGKVLTSRGVGVPPAYSSSPTVSSIILTNNTNQVVLGTTNTTTITMASLGASRVVTLPDANSNTVRPTTSSAGQAVGYIDSDGNQNMITVTSQALTGLSQGVGTITASDTILSAIGKLSGTQNGNSTAVTTATSVSITQYQKFVRVTATGQTITLPSASSIFLTPGDIVVIIFPTAVVSPGTIAVHSGDSLNGTVNGTFAVPAVVTGNSPCRVAWQDPSSGWFTC